MLNLLKATKLGIKVKVPGNSECRSTTFLYSWLLQVLLDFVVS